MNILQRANREGGLAVPNFRLYYIAAQFGYFLGWWIESSLGLSANRGQGREPLPKVAILEGGMQKCSILFSI